MGGVDSDPGDHEAGTDPLTVQLLADLQAGLLDDATAARVRDRVRKDPAAAQALAGLNRVRCDIAALGEEAAPAPDAPAAVVARIEAALRAARPSRSQRRAGAPAAHTVRPTGRAARVLAAVAGLSAAVAVAGLGTAALIGAPAPTPSGPTTVQHVTVSRTPVVIPLSDPQILALLDDTPDYGPLGDPHRRASCLTGLGYPAAVRVLGAQPIEVAGRAGVLLVLPGDTPGALAAVAVAPTCSAADTGLLANRLVRRP